MKKEKKCAYSKCPFDNKMFTPRFSSLEKTHFNYLCQSGYLKEFNSKKGIEKRFKGMKTEVKAAKKSVFNYLQDELNHIARLIDYGQDCSSCAKKYGTYVMHGGHVRSVGGQNSIRYHLLNIFCQCLQCNKHKHGNGTEYVFRLKEIFGQEYIDELDNLVADHPRLELNKVEAKEKLKLARQIVFDLKKRGELIYSPKMRLEMRRQINKTLGIYKEINKAA